MEAWRALRCCSPARPLALLRGGGAAVSPTPRLRPTAVLMSAAAAARRSAYDGLLVDAGGTLLQLARPVEETYASIGRKYGLNATESEIKQGFKRAFAAPWPEKLRYQGDGRVFWRLVVSEATGCDRDDYFEEVYEEVDMGMEMHESEPYMLRLHPQGITSNHFANGSAWHLPTGASEGLCLLKDAGVKLAVVSNFDTRLRKLLKELNVAHLFDAIIVSSEVGYEKPDAKIFTAALDQIGVEASRAVHVGDDEKADKAGASAIGINCWLWGSDVKTFDDICDRILMANS